MHVGWQRSDGGSLALNVTVPPGSAGEVHVPKLHGEATVVRESGSVVWSSSGVELGASAGVAHVGGDGWFLLFETASGSYAFVAARDRAPGRIPPFTRPCLAPAAG